MLDLLRQAAEQGRKIAQLQGQLNIWRDSLVDLAAYKPDEAGERPGMDFDDFLKTVTVSTLWMGLPPEVGIINHNGVEFERYSQENPPPKNVNRVATWNLRQVDAHLGSFAIKEALKYKSVFAKPKT